MMMKLYTQLKVSKARSQGQGVVEYAGALVVAALVVAAVIGLGPSAIQSAFSSIMTNITSTLTGSF